MRTLHFVLLFVGGAALISCGEASTKTIRTAPNAAPVAFPNQTKVVSPETLLQRVEAKLRAAKSVSWTTRIDTRAPSSSKGDVGRGPFIHCSYEGDGARYSIEFDHSKGRYGGRFWSDGKLFARTLSTTPPRSYALSPEFAPPSVRLPLDPVVTYRLGCLTLFLGIHRWAYVPTKTVGIISRGEATVEGRVVQVIELEQRFPQPKAKHRRIPNLDLRLRLWVDPSKLQIVRRELHLKRPSGMLAIAIENSGPLELNQALDAGRFVTTNVHVVQPSKPVHDGDCVKIREVLYDPPWTGKEYDVDTVAGAIEEYEAFLPTLRAISISHAQLKTELNKLIEACVAYVKAAKPWHAAATRALQRQQRLAPKAAASSWPSSLPPPPSSDAPVESIEKLRQMCKQSTLPTW